MFISYYVYILVYILILQKILAFRMITVEQRDNQKWNQGLGIFISPYEPCSWVLCKRGEKLEKQN